MDKWRIMTVDDEEDIRVLIKAILSSNFEVVEAHDGLDALEKLERYEPDFIIMDVVMPLMNGLDASIAIRESSKFNHVPILFLSSLSTKEDMQKAYRSGADLFLTKPIDPSHLISTVQSFLQKGSRKPQKKKYSLQDLETWHSPAVKEAAPAKPPQKATEKKEPKITEFEKIASKQPQPERRRSPYVEFSSQDLPRVMIVDDEPDMRDFLRLSLQEHFEVVSACDGIEAIRKVVGYQPDLFILDIMLPKMSGYQICQSLRRNRTYGKAPIIMISAKSTRKDKEYSLRMGADAFLSKPFYAKDLLLEVYKVIEKHGMTVRTKSLTIEDIEERQNEEKRTFDEKDERILMRKEESEIQRLLRREMEKEQREKKK